ncbi:MAG: response regulator [Deltaproteobacteria bacterium]
MNILVVDDDARLCRAVVDELARLGHEATPVYSAKSALEVLFSENIDILLTDLRMTGKDGIELIDLARGASPHTRTLLMSAYATAQDYKAAIAMGAVDVLTKPFTPKDLQQAIEKATDCLDGYHGNIHGLTLPDILQAFSLARSSITVHVGTHGIVHVQRGEVVHAELGEHTGLVALREIMHGRSGRIHTSPSRENVPRTIEGRTDHLLIRLQAESETPEPPVPTQPLEASPEETSAPVPAPTGEGTEKTVVERVEATRIDPAEPFANAPAAQAEPLEHPAGAAASPRPLGTSPASPLAGGRGLEHPAPLPFDEEEERKKGGAWIWMAAAAALLLFGVWWMWPATEVREEAAPVAAPTVVDDPEPSAKVAGLDAPEPSEAPVPEAPDAEDAEMADDAETVEPSSTEEVEAAPKRKVRRRRVRRRRAPVEDEAVAEVTEQEEEPEVEEAPPAAAPAPKLEIIEDTRPQLDVLDDDKPRIGTIDETRPNVGTLED